MTDVAPLVRVLAEQTAVFDRLLLSVRSMELLVTAGEAQFLATAVDETSALFGRLSALELAREIATAAIAEQMGLVGSDPTLDEIVAALGESEGAAVAALGAKLRRQATEYEAVTTGGITGLVEQRLDALDETIDRVERGDVFVDAYGALPAAVYSGSVPALSVNTGA